MRYNTKLVELAAAVDWGVFRKEGDSYLRRLGVSDDVAIWLAAKLYLLNWQGWRRGKTWNSRRCRWESDRCRARTYQTCLGRTHPDEQRAQLSNAWAQNHGESAPRWTAETESVLMTLRAQGRSYSQIATMMGKTKAAIQARVRYLNLGRRLTKAEGLDEVEEQGIGVIADEPHPT